jgi:hypothetical protein
VAVLKDQWVTSRLIEGSLTTCPYMKEEGKEEEKEEEEGWVRDT